MKVKCFDLRDFLENLESADSLFQRAVYADITRQPIAHSAGVACAWEICFQASAVVCYADGSEVLVDCGQLTGVVNRARNGTDEGQTVADGLLSQLRDACERHGWTLRPGILDL